MNYIFFKQLTLASIIAFSIPALFGMESNRQDTDRGGFKRSISAINPEAAVSSAVISTDPLNTEDIFRLVASHLTFKEYLGKLSSLCNTFRQRVIKYIVNFSDHDESSFLSFETYNKTYLDENGMPLSSEVPLPMFVKWNYIPQDYKNIILAKKHFVSAFTSLISLDLSRNCLGWRDTGVGLEEHEDSSNFDENDPIGRCYFLRGKDLPCFTNLTKLDVTDNNLIDGGSWASHLTSLTSLRMSLHECERDDTPCIDSALEIFPHLKELYIQCFTPFNYENIFGLTNLTHLTIDMSNIIYEYAENNIRGSQYILENLLWEKLPELNIYDYYPYEEMGNGVRQTRANFLAMKDAEKDFLTTFYRENPSYNFQLMNKELCKFRDGFYENLST